MGRTKSTIKIKEIKTDIKVISKKNDSNNKPVTKPSLEEEVSSDDLPTETVSNDATSVVTPIRSQNNVRVITRASTTAQNEMKEDQAMFSQSRIYSSSPNETVVPQRTYVSASESIRRFNPSITPTQSLSPESKTDDPFTSLDMNRSRGHAQTRNYNEPLDLKEAEKKKRMPWEI
ncbi:MAG: hypothetical protein WCK29_00240 [archaeon]